MNIKHLFTKDFLFQSPYLGLQRADKALAILGLISVVVAVVLKVMAARATVPVTTKYYNKLYRLFLTIGIMLEIWFACAYEQLRFINWHFFAILILFLGLVWFVKILLSMQKNYSAEKTQYEKEQLKLKYLPK